MSKTLFYLLFVLAGCVGVTACSSDDDGAKDGGRIGVKNVYTTGCKTGGMQEASNGTDAAYALDGAEEYIEYKSKADGYVYVTHVNAMFNCCSEEIKVGVTISGNNIVVTEDETSSACNCVCPFDVSYEIGKLVPGQYNVTVKVAGIDRVSFPFTYPSDGKIEINKE